MISSETDVTIQADFSVLKLKSFFLKFFIFLQKQTANEIFSKNQIHFSQTEDFKGSVENKAYDDHRANTTVKCDVSWCIVLSCTHYYWLHLCQQANTTRRSVLSWCIALGCTWYYLGSVLFGPPGLQPNITNQLVHHSVAYSTVGIDLDANSRTVQCFVFYAPNFKSRNYNISFLTSIKGYLVSIKV